MHLFKKEVTIKSDKSKEEVIAVIDRHIEPFHKDSSTLLFEGRISPEGVFKLNVAPYQIHYRTYSGVLDIKGYVKEDENGSVTQIVFGLSKTMLFLIYSLVPILLLLTALLLSGIVQLEVNLWFMPLLFLAFFMVNFSITFRNERIKALRLLKRIIW